MAKLMIDSVKVVPGKAGKGDLYVITSGEETYLCFQKEIVDKEGQEVEGEVGSFKSGKASFKMAGVASAASGKPDSGGPGWRNLSGGKSFGRSPEDLALTAKTMSASYAKDLVIAYSVESFKNHPERFISFDLFLAGFRVAYEKVYGSISGTDPAPARKEAKPDPTGPGPGLTEKFPEKTPNKALEEKKEEQKAPPPSKTDRNEVTCGGANAKLKGKTVSDKFCKVCSFHSKCGVRNDAAPLESKPSGKSSDLVPVSSAPSDQKKSDERVPVAFIMQAMKEQKRVGKESFHCMIETFGVKSASEIKDSTQQEAFLGCLAALGDEK